MSSDLLLDLLTVGACCALGAFLISLRMRDSGRMKRSGALFIAMLALLLGRLFPHAFVVCAGIGMAAALAYAVSALGDLRRRERDDEPEDR